MGQINCQCQQAIPIQEQKPKNNDNRVLQVTSLPYPDLSSIQQVYTEVLLTNANGSLSIRIRERQKVTFGTTNDCYQTPIALTSNSFKLELKLFRGNLTVKDCGVGYGVFLLKKKLFLKSNGDETLISLQQDFLLVKITENQLVSFTIFGPQREQKSCIGRKNQHQIAIGQTTVTLKRQKQGKQYSLKRQDRKWLCVLASQQKKLKPKDIIRLGTQFYAVQSFTDYIESSKVVEKK